VDVEHQRLETEARRRSPGLCAMGVDRRRNQHLKEHGGVERHLVALVPRPEID
jgi:hypothetical protein